jgi:outer membrane protein assembly factor BamB
MLLSGALLLATAASALHADEPSQSDWPQWRGPDRDGVAPSSPPLIDKWPKEGPKRLWLTKGIPGCRKYGWDSNKDGGSGSPSVAGGKLVLYAHRKIPREFTVEEELLREWGWHPEMPKELADKVEAERFKLFPKYGRIANKPQADTAIEKLIGELTDNQKKFEQAVRNRLTNGRLVHLVHLNNLAKVRGRKFKSIEAMDRAAGGTANYHGGRGGATINVYFHNLADEYFDVVYCLDTDNGDILWEKKHPGEVPTKMSFQWTASSTPTLSGDRCYVQGSKALYCFTMGDGKLIWKQDSGCSMASPLVLGEKVIASNPQLAAYNAADGKELWRNPEVVHQNSSPNLWRKDGKDFLLCYSKDKLVCVRPDDGKAKWQTWLGAKSGDQSPILVGDIALIRAYTNMSAVDLSGAKPTQLWRNRDGNRGASPVIYKDRIFTQYSKIVCRDLKNGEEKWSAGRHKTESCSPIVADGKVITWVYEDNKWFIVQFDATADSYQEQGRLKLDAGAYSSPAIAGGKLYLRLDDGVACYDLRK